MSQIDALRDLRSDLRKRGLFKRPTARLIAELLVHVVVLFAGVGWSLAADSLWLKMAGLVVATMGAMGIGTNTHTSSHAATSDRKWLNDALTYFGYPLMLGLSATYWWNKHVLRHHSGPNMKGIDGDFDLLPWFAGTWDDVEASKGWRRVYYEHLQGWIFPLAVAFTLVAQQLAGCIYVLRSLRDRNRRHSQYWIDAGALTAHVAIWLIVPAAFFTLSEVVALYAIRSLLNSYAMFIVFAPAHMPAAALRLANDSGSLKLPSAHISTTLNFKTGRIGNWLCGGLQYQIEHHLMPDISHVYYGQVSPLVQRFCRDHGIPYRCYGWGKGVWLALMSIRTPNRLESIRRDTFPPSLIIPTLSNRTAQSPEG